MTTKPGPSQSFSVCGNCTHRVEGECRRFPPQVTVVMMPVQTALSAPRLQPTPIACFPPVEEDLHCAEFAGQYTLMKGN